MRKIESLTIWERLGERDARIEELLRKLHFAEENANKRDLEELVERLRDEIDFLKKKFNSQIEDWEDQLRQKDRVNFSY